MAVKIAGYEDYLIYPDGQVFSLKTNKILRPFEAKTGYLVIELRNKNGAKKFSIHRLVATAFIPNPQNLQQVNHKDECKTNNNVENLEWCTAKYNMTYNNLQQRIHEHTDYTSEVFKRVGRQVGKLGRKAVCQFTKNGDFVSRYDSIRDAEIALGTKNTHICSCCKGDRKTSNGYVWKYEKEEI